MTAPDAIAERLHRLYIDELQQSLMPPIHRRVNERQTQALIRRARNGGPGLCEGPDATTWLWSDLHLGDMASIVAFDRPFEMPYEVDQIVMDAWYELVGAAETIICLGDVSVDGSVLAHHQEWWREAPGVKWLVLCNHDGNARGLRMLGFTVQHTLALCATDPPLALTKDSDRYRIANFIEGRACSSSRRETHREPARWRPSPTWSPSRR